MTNNSLEQIQEDLTQQVSNIAMISYLEGSIQSIEAMHKAFSALKEMGPVPLSVVLDSLDSMLKEQNDRLEGIKKIHQNPE
jgi:Cdc6-like AAA superfamily ATPase